LQPEALGADRLDEIRQPVVVEIALTMGGGIEVDAVDNALQARILFGDLAQVRGELFADLVRELTDDRPNGFLGIRRRQRKIKADELVVFVGELKGLFARANFARNAVQLVIVNVAEALGEDQREDEVLLFGRVSGAADRTGRLPDPGFERSCRSIVTRHDTDIF
jgi:hypothetical protein